LLMIFIPSKIILFGLCCPRPFIFQT